MSAYGEDSQSDNEWLKLGQRRLKELELSDASVAGLNGLLDAFPETTFKGDALTAIGKAEIERDRMAAAKAAFAREDVNRDNTVDILDAFALARQIEGAQVVPAAYDFNNDGAIDRADVDWVARVSVKL